MMKTVIVVGGGASGLMASVVASKNNKVILIDKNEKLGKKIYITGKGRCNLTNNCDVDIFTDKIIRNPKFLYSSFKVFNNYDTINFFNKNGLATKEERGNRIFPASDHASDVTKVLTNITNDNNVDVRLNTTVDDIIVENGKAVGVSLKGKIIKSDAVVIATGGFSYPSTGSTGDGYKFAKKTGHNIIETSPSLVGFNIADDICKQLQGLTLKNIEVSLIGAKKSYKDFGELLFTHYGVSGPIILKMSSIFNEQIQSGELAISIDIKPKIETKDLEKRVISYIESSPKKKAKYALKDLMPHKLCESILEKSGINIDKRSCDITKEQRDKFIYNIKNLKLNIGSLRGYNEAVITKGGVDVKNINPKTMESKLIKNLYFTGEVLDVDALTGGFNLQIAWTTGYACGISI